jgi:uncharacterized protein YjhX (UPF0386 family)
VLKSTQKEHMARFDGVIEAARYKGGKIEVVRAYERRGATFSDWVLLDRAALVKKLKQGRQFVTGRRKEYLASTFEVGKPVNLIGRDGGQVLTTLAESDEDRLEGVPIF